MIFRYWDNCNLKVLDSFSLQEGDLVFRRGKSIESLAVVLAEKNSSFSHIGLIVMERGIPFVIHAEPGENSAQTGLVRKEPLRSFLDPRKASHFAIFRSYLDRKSLTRVAAQARTFYIQQCRFDNSYDLFTDQNLYCTELVLKAYRQGDQNINILLRRLDEVNILLARRKILMPGAFITSRLFYKIYTQ
ncbi:MAG: YiiX/YebB-like N1pC/P60 family cysteine hydrolase [Bacteroidetes bacterium]|nr:YiiX/YebB-like N1pC/P60 family cysteine hydrolase [Bacteroidota bacterium]